MDRKSITILVVSFALLALLPYFANRIWPPQPVPLRPNQLAMATNQSMPGTNLPPAPVAEATNLPPARVETRPLVALGTQEEKVTVQNQDAQYVFTSFGGGLQEVELKKYAAVVKCGRRALSDTNRVTLNTAAPVPALAILDGDVVQGDGVFKVSEIPGGGARSEKLLTNGLRLVKEFRVETNFLIQVSVRLENQSKNPLTLPAQEWVLGTASALGGRDDPTRVGVHWYDGKSKETVDASWFAPRKFCMPSAPRAEYLQGSNNVVWAALRSQFFTLAVIPKQPAPELRVVPVNLPEAAGAATNNAADAAKNASLRQGVKASFVYPGSTLGPGQSIERQFVIYAGPKEYQRLVRIGEQYQNHLDLIMDYDGFWGWFAQALLTSMNGLNALGLGYALAIIAITIIIKLLFWPLTNASTRSMKRMAALQPQMKAIQVKFKEDPAKMNRKMMEFMKENKVSPLGGCLPMLLQIPVFFGFFRMIQSAIELRGAQFLWCCDLSKPDTVFVLPGFNIPVNPLPLIMGVTMLWQARLTPVSPGMDPAQQKIMKYMPLMFLVILYNFSAGLTLYWTVQNLLTIAQMKLTKTNQPAAAGARPPQAPPPGPPRRRK
jgi:YidC/Oxa1 family membrane protein insertase